MDDFSARFLTYMVLLDPKLIVSLLVKDAQLDDTHRSREKRKIIYGGTSPGDLPLLPLFWKHIERISLTWVCRKQSHLVFIINGFQTITFEPDSFDKGLLAK
jgi:hypothetical protein